MFTGIGLIDKSIEANRCFVPAEIYATGFNGYSHHGYKHDGSGLSDNLKYKAHNETESELVFYLESDVAKVTVHYEFLNGRNTLCSYTEIENIGADSLGLEYVSSFCVYGFEMDNVLIPHNSWCSELDWRRYSAAELGYSHLGKISLKRIKAANTGTWSTKEYLPMGIIEGADGCILWQIESNGSWNWEISDAGGAHYLKLSGPSEQENGWWKNLKKGEKFKSLRTAVCFGEDFNKVIEEITIYRRSISVKTDAKATCNVAFDDSMAMLIFIACKKQRFGV